MLLTSRLTSLFLAAVAGLATVTVTAHPVQPNDDALESRIHRGDALESRIHRGDALESRIHRGDALESRIHRGDALESRIYRGLYCAPSSQWKNGTLYYGGIDGTIEGKLGIRSYHNATDNTTEHRLTIFDKSVHPNVEALHVNGVYCDGTMSFNYTYDLGASRPAGKHNPLKLRTPAYNTPVTYGDGSQGSLPACLGIGWSGDFYNYPHTSAYATVPGGTYPLSIRECSDVDFKAQSSTAVQFFQELYPHHLIETATGKSASLGANPPNRFKLVVEPTTGDIMATTLEPHATHVQFSIQ